MRGLDLFSGAGGLTIGLKRAGIMPVVAVEKNKDAATTYASHTPEAEHFCDDIRNVDLGPWRGKIDLLYGGPPCQPFSTGGLRQAQRDSRDMIPAFLSAVETVQPAAILMENVPGLAVASRISHLYRILAKVETLGYKPSWRILNAADYGIPQKRRRLFIIAFRDHHFWFPRPTHGPDTARPHVPSKTVLSFEPLGEPPDCPVKYAKYPDLRPSPYAGHVYNGGGRPIDLESPCHTILASAGGYKTHWVDRDNIVINYHRHLRSGGKPCEGQVPGARRLTVEESAQLQTFPRRLRFAGSRSSQYTQVGDAVPPMLAAKLARAIVSQLAGRQPAERWHFQPQVAHQLSLEW